MYPALTANDQQPSTYLTAREAARYLNLSVSTLAKWRVYGGGPVYNSFGRAVRYSEEALREWASARNRTSTSA